MISPDDCNILEFIDKISDIKNKLLKLIDKFSSQRILVLGDLMVDRYLWSSVDRISQEAPVPIAKIENETYVPGGAANAIYNLASLGIHVVALGTVGDDLPGKQLVEQLAKKRVDVSEILVDPSRPTTVKTRIMSGNYQLIRFDYESQIPINRQAEGKFLKALENKLSGTKILVISDYSKGLLSDHLARRGIEISIRANVKTLVDPTSQSFLKYRRAYLIKPNKNEAESISGELIRNDYSNLKAIGQKVLRKLKTDVVCITLGKDGMAIVNSFNNIFRIPTAGREVYDVSGAGDTTMATLAASLASGSSLREAATLANIAAGIVVGKLGTSTCTSTELISRLKKAL